MAKADTPDQPLRDLKINDNAPTTRNSANPPIATAGEASDDASIASSSRPRRHRRGGRKTNSHMVPVEETRLHWTERLDEGMNGLEDGGMRHMNGQGEKSEMPKAREVSDNASVASSSRPRRYKRGGRRKERHMAAVDEAGTRLPWSERAGRLGEEIGGPAERKAVYEKRSPSRKADEKARPVDGEQNSSQEKKEKAPDTEIRAFNIKRLQGKMPFGISIDRGEGAEGTGENADGKEEKEEKEEKNKPISIRLDINLEVEVFLKTAIKGDVTITFLE